MSNFLDSGTKRKTYSLILGILYVFISYGTASLFFSENISMAMIMLITLLFVPTVSRFIEKEVDARENGKTNVFKHNKTLIEVFFFLFIGISIGYFIIGSVYSDSIQYQTDMLQNQIKVNIDGIQKGPQALSLMINNIEVILVAFVLSLFYDVGALFLIVRTASVFAGFILKFSSFIAEKTALNAAIFSIHFIPEIFGFLLAALAGGVISKALVKKNMETSQFRKIIRDGTVLLVISICIIVFAALLEAFVTPEIMKLFLSKV
ncbi:MAG: stage II sporulation protein M [Nanoarchaeota archaeon]